MHLCREKEKWDRAKKMEREKRCNRILTHQSLQEKSHLALEYLGFFSSFPCSKIRHIHFKGVIWAILRKARETRPDILRSSVNLRGEKEKKKRNSSFFLLFLIWGIKESQTRQEKHLLWSIMENVIAAFPYMIQGAYSASMYLNMFYIRAGNEWLNA